MNEFIDKIKKNETIYDIHDSERPHLDGTSLVIPEQPGPEPVATIDGVDYFHKKEFNLEALIVEYIDTYIDILTGEILQVEDLPDVFGSCLYVSDVEGVNLELKYDSNEGDGEGFLMYGEESSFNEQFTSCALVCVDNIDDVDDNTKICLPSCSNFYGYLSEDTKTFIAYFNLKGEIPEKINSIKQGNNVMPLHDTRIPDVSSADENKVLTVNNEGKIIASTVTGINDLFSYAGKFEITNEDIGKKCNFCFNFISTSNFDFNNPNTAIQDIAKELLVRQIFFPGFMETVDSATRMPCEITMNTLRPYWAIDLIIETEEKVAGGDTEVYEFYRGSYADFERALAQNGYYYCLKANIYTNQTEELNL